MSSADRINARDAEIESEEFVALFTAPPDSVSCHRCRTRFLSGEEIVLVHGHWQHALFATCQTREGSPTVTDPDWLYNEASGALYGPSDSPHLRVIVATEVDPKFGRLIADTMNGSPPAEMRHTTDKEA